MSAYKVIRPGDPPPSCQHYRVDNETWQCKACGERMLSQTVDAETVQSAPNAAAGLCTIPDCDGEAAHGCTAVYVPDYSRAKTVVIGYNATYQCERGSNNGSVFTYGEEPVWDCGHVHRGDRIPVRAEAQS
jgi:hypothetical protein